MSHHLGAVAVAGMHVAVYRVVCLCDAHHLCHHVGCSPRRTAEVLVWVIVVDGHVWADGIYRLFLSADDGRLLDVSHHPVVHLSIFQQFKLLCQSVRRCGGQKQSAQCYSNTFYHVVDFLYDTNMLQSYSILSYDGLFVWCKNVQNVLFARFILFPGGNSVFWGIKYLWHSESTL